MKVKREETKSIKKAVSNYSELDSKTKRQIITELIELINIKHEEYIEEKNKRICEAEGHIFGKWKYETYQTTSKVGIGGYIYPEIITQDIYTKKCERCGALKMVGYKPEDYDEQVALEKEEIERREKQLIKD